MTFRLHPQAEKELDAAAEYYESRQPGLGLEFVEEVYTTIARICDFPEAWSLLSKRTRRCLMNRFPYGVVYEVRAESVRIIAVANLQRRPDYWRGRK